MAGSTESNKRMGEMVKTVSAHGCPKGYTGTPPDCKKIKSTDVIWGEGEGEGDASVVYDKETTKKQWKGKERRQQRRKNRKERRTEKKENKDK